MDGAIHRAGGSTVLEECRMIIARQGGCKVGEAVITTAGNLPARSIIHTVGPVWNGGLKGESEKLTNCFKNSLELAEASSSLSIAFPNLSTGIYRFPKDKLASIAVNQVSAYLSNNLKIQKVIFVCFDD